MSDVIALLEVQAKIARELALVAERQSAVIASQRPDDLLEVLQARQRLVQRFDAAQERVSEAMAARTPVSGAQARVDALIAEITQHVECVLERDEADQAALAASRDAAGSELRRLESTSRARRAYGAPGSHPRFADERG